MKNLLKRAVSNLGYEIKRTQPTHEMRGLELLNQLRKDANHDDDLRRFLRFVMRNLSVSRSQIFQDLFVLSILGEKRSGYFVEFGAADGEFLSNSVLLERGYGWRGIVAEPSRGTHAALQANRACSVDLRCVWTKTGETLQFSESPETVFSTISSARGLDERGRDGAIEYPVETVSLNDLLIEHNSPKEIDYLSIDTEGTELPILSAFDFSKRSFRVITVEHNYGPQRQQIFSLLTSLGYKRMFESISLWDDWYVLA
ncbi:FkbM family methyltransferase [Bradyrhizobium icense]|uniref:Methyltransferase FkbM domain-containing protein n=1 Tax=Bradyrhizobium icense TaxID=1274631 RepID=A0A1B1UD87_9BRAD|nr:FkbM family methyltransferase [Bradyrhizobium icense]ANW00701.1 hypothetical protein LMTR13_11485 [Bradyrhizobium icense]